MSFFSRLSDIISCNLNDLLANADDPRAALSEVIAEMEQGVAGARRSAVAAVAAEEKLRLEMEDLRGQITLWTDRAREELGYRREDEARQALLRKRETEDLLAGLQQQHTASIATRDQLQTTLRAIEARLADACRRQQGFGVSTSPAASAPLTSETSPSAVDQTRAAQIEAELAALRRELQGK